MTDQDMPRPRRMPPRTSLGIAAAALLAVGGGAGAVAGHAFKPAVEMAPMQPAAIQTLAEDGGIVTIRGRVAETFGNKYVIDDGSARALVDTGRAGDETVLVKSGDRVTVQGRFERGFVHASFLVDGTGKVTALGPPPHDRHGPPPPPPGAAPPPPPVAAVTPPPSTPGGANSPSPQPAP